MVDNKQLADVLAFWFEELSSEDWFDGSDELDEKITQRFTDLHSAVAAGEFWKQRTSAENILAEILVLDQFSRNIYRNEAKAFAYDGMALTLAQQAVGNGWHNELSPEQRLFLYMPFMHSESRAIHEEALRLFESLGNGEALKYEKIHKDIIDRFGRYPHRNEQLGRESTPEEQKYLANNDEAFFDS